MSSAVIDTLVGTSLFILGVSITIKTYGKHHRLAFTVVAVISPLVAVVSVFNVFWKAISRKRLLVPCPEGLEEAERMVAVHRQRLFGGTLREPSLTASWRHAYERELQSETEKVQRVAEKFFVVAEQP